MTQDVMPQSGAVQINPWEDNIWQTTLFRRSSKKISNQKNTETRCVPVFRRNLTVYLHIGHAKSICLNFTTAAKYGGKCNLRYDDTNPVKEDVEYVDSIEEDVRWLGFEWDKRLWASDYFDQMYEAAVETHKKRQSFRM